MTYCISPEELRKKIARDPQAAEIYRAAQERAAALREHFHDDPAHTSGWFHNFCCPKCASLLHFDLLEDRKPGDPFVCPKCGERAAGQDYDEAWIYEYRQEYAEHLSDFTLLALGGDDTAADFIFGFIDFYAEHYDDFPVHGRWAGKGKIMGQGLDEAVFALAVFRALWPLRDRVPAEKIARWYERCFRPMSEFLLDQKPFQTIHNISLWMRCAVAGAAMLGGDREMFSRAMDGDVGIRKQIEKGYTMDGVWYECSFGYHYYSTEALTQFMMLYAADPLSDPADPLFDALKKAYEVPLCFSHDGYALPALSDGWYPLGLPGKQLLRAARLLPDSDVRRQLDGLRNRQPELFGSVAALLYVADLPACATSSADLPAFQLFADTRLAVFHVGAPVIFRAGIRDFSHMHDDYLSVSVPPFSDDLGTPGYGHPLCDRYYRRSFCHNTVSADGHSQPHVYRDTGIAAVPGGVRGTALSLWEGIDAVRELTEKDGEVTDVTTLASETAHDYDWFFHATGAFSATRNGEALSGVPAVIAGDGYDLLDTVRACGNANGTTLRWEKDGKTLVMEVCSDAELFFFRSPGNPADERRDGVMLRVRAANAAFRVRYRVEG